MITCQWRTSSPPLRPAQILARDDVSPHIFIHDELFESPDKKYACLFYTITEFRMGSEAALIAVFENKDNTSLILNPADQWFDYQGDSSIAFFHDLIFVRKLAYNQDEKLSGTPFVVYNIINKTFGFIDFDWSSVYYSIIRISDTLFKFYLDTPEATERLTSKRHNDMFDVSTIQYYPFDEVNNLTELYFEEKRRLLYTP